MICVFVFTLPSIVPRPCIEAELAVITIGGILTALEVVVGLIGAVVTGPGLAVVGMTPLSDPCPV